MNKNIALLRVALLVFLGLGMLCIVHSFYFYPQLPDVVASHFGASGKPDAWSSRNVFVAVYLVSVLMNGVIFLAIAYGIRSIPYSLVNLPHKEFWLSPERRNETYRFFFHYFLWLGSATFLLLLDVFHQSFIVHTGRSETLSHPWMSISLYLGFTIAWCIGLFLKFFRKPEPEQDQTDIL